MPRTRWTILSPAEIGSVLRAFDAMANEATTESERLWRFTAKGMVTTMLYAWLRRGELQGLRWCDVELANPDGQRLHVRRTFVRGHYSVPKTDEGTRVIALAAPLLRGAVSHLEASSYRGAEDSVFCHPRRAHPSRAVTSRCWSLRRCGAQESSAPCGSTTTGGTPASGTPPRRACRRSRSWRWLATPTSRRHREVRRPRGRRVLKQRRVAQCPLWRRDGSKNPVRSGLPPRVDGLAQPC